MADFFGKIADFWASIKGSISGLVAFVDGGEDSKGAKFVKDFSDFMVGFFGGAQKAAEELDK